MRISIIGLGYIGLPTAIVFAKAGHEVIGFDVNESVIESLNAGHIHIVEKGQNLFRIGLRYNVPYAKMEEMNGDVAKNLTIGARLKIPVKAIHKITNGETIESIAAKYGNPASDLIKANQLSDGEQLEVGDELVIPLSKK